jgi:carboxyl-terminal processing protease
MSSRSRWLVVLVSTPLVLFIVVGALLGAAPRTQGQVPAEIQTFRDVLSLVIQGYVERADIDRVMDGAMRGLTESLDSSSAFLSAAEVRALDAKTPPALADIGVVVMRQFWLRVIGLRDGSPAARAGIQSGDFIRMIDGQPTRDMSSFTGNRLLRGAPGSKVALMVIRGNAADPHEFTLERAVPPAAPADLVKVKPLNGKTTSGAEAHVRVTSFGAGTVAALRQAFATLQKEGATGAIIDLRDTADGAIEDGIEAARLFLKSGTTIAIRATRSPERTTITAGATDGVVTMPVALLVSNGTARAAEVFAAALGGNSRAELVGEVTAGLASEQQLVRLSEGRGLWLTSARYLLVDGSGAIDERGVRPTVGVDIPSPGFDELRPATDEPLLRAADALRKSARSRE